MVFVDDKLSNVNSVEKAFDGGAIQYVSYRYGAADARVKSMRKDVAEYELKTFVQCMQFVSDEVASACLAEGKVPRCEVR